MVSSPVDPDQYKNTHNLKFFQNQADEASEIGTEQLFRLIDSILPFEACLYYQILPLSIEGKYLKLGMVNPEDLAALDYARQILVYLNYLIKIKPIAVDTHQAILSAYLNYIGSSKLSSEEKITISDSTQGNSFRFLSARDSHVPVLEVKAEQLYRPIQSLATLPPPQLLEELLSRVLIGGIGRLYFERQQDQGRILCSQDGILQSVLENLSLPVFQGVINELKRLANLPFLPIQQPKQVEIERQYEQNQLLLRLKLMPSENGEEATLQVLRGAALKFYQQQQVENLSRDALSLGQQLHRKLHEISDRLNLNPTMNAGQLTLPALYQLMAIVDKQLEALRELQAKSH